MPSLILLMTVHDSLSLTERVISCGKLFCEQLGMGIQLENYNHLEYCGNKVLWYRMNWNTVGIERTDTEWTVILWMQKTLKQNELESSGYRRHWCRMNYITVGKVKIYIELKQFLVKLQFSWLLLLILSSVMMLGWFLRTSG